jgi:hypothetical protein
MEQLIVILAIGAFIVLAHFTIKYLNMATDTIEGLENRKDSSPNKGMGIEAKDTASKIKSLSIELTDKLLVPKYKKDYETLIINFEEYINALMLTKVLETGNGNVMNTIYTLAAAKIAKESLNDVMKYVDTYTTVTGL